MRSIQLVSVFSVFLVCASNRAALAQAVWCVDSSVTSSGNGMTWANAKKTLQEGIDAATASNDPPDQVWVKQDEYKPGNITDSFFLESGVRVYGGFDGTESLTPISDVYDPREFDADGQLVNVTILSGELDSLGYSDNVEVIVTAPGDDSEYVLDGFTIEGAQNNAITAIGSGPSGSSGTFRHLIVQDNESINSGVLGGAGMYVTGSTSVPTIEHCIFRRNTLVNSSFGGAGLCVDFAQANVSHCEFSDNYESGAAGGGLSVDSGTVRLRHCKFIDNTTNNSMGGGGASLSFMPHDTPIVDCLFEGNRAICDDCIGTSPVGGGVYDHSQGLYLNCQFIDNKVCDGEECSAMIGSGGGLFVAADKSATVVNSLFEGNSAQFGGGAFFESQSGQGGTLLNCTIADNEASVGTFSAGGVLVAGSGTNLIVVNSVLWGNMGGPSGSIERRQVNSQSGSPTVSYSCVEDGSEGSAPSPFGEATNIDTDPEFADASNGDYRLLSASECIDAGDNTPVPDDILNVDEDSDFDEPTPDLDLRHRIIFGLGVPGQINQCDPIVDLGAYEYRYDCEECLSLGDMNFDGELDGQDIQHFVDCFVDGTGGDDCGCACGDYFGHDGVKINDVPFFVECILTKGAECFEVNECGVAGPRSASDCNENEVNDNVDILFCDPQIDPGLCDCNGNGIPDECDIAECNSDWSCGDVNGNDVPDGCEPDCQNNHVPDSYDISTEASEDCNSNGVPDECDFDCNDNDIPDDCEELESDCNENGIPDECEYDCDENGVPDECDLDPLDPDGDEWVDPDCNGNGWPDSCDIDEGPPFGSLDANENEIPDECEEEEESLMGGGEGGGESMMSGGGSCDASYWPADYSVLSNEMYAAWEEFMLWCMQEDWGPDSEFSGAEQLERLIEKKEELGICDGGESEE